MKSVSKVFLAAAIALSSASAAYAQDKEHEAHHAAPGAQAAEQSAASSSMTAGEIRKVDKQAGKVTIRHEELKNLDMPAMTMVFRATDLAMLDRVKAGDKVSFIADKVGGQYVVTEMEVKE